MDVIGVTSTVTLYVLLTVAVVTDYASRRISNRLILLGLGVSLLFRILGQGIEGVAWYLPGIVFPVICLYLMYLAGALGAGDIKLLSVVGGFLNFKELLECIVAVFIIAAVISFTQLLVKGVFIARISSAFAYFRSLARGNLAPYEQANKEERFHFSLAVLLGVAAVQLYSLWR